MAATASSVDAVQLLYNLWPESSVNEPVEVAAVLVEYQRAARDEGQYLFERLARFQLHLLKTSSVIGNILINPRLLTLVVIDDRYADKTKSINCTLTIDEEWHLIIYCRLMQVSERILAVIIIRSILKINAVEWRMVRAIEDFTCNFSGRQGTDHFMVTDFFFEQHR